MAALDLTRLLMLAGFMIIWLMYIVQAFNDRTEQGVLTLLLPGYVLYYAYARSTYGVGIRVAMAVFLAGVFIC